MSTRQYPQLDLFKFVAALLVVAIHAQPLDGTPRFILIDLLSRWAVPFFFITSAYLYFRRAASERSVRHYISRLLRLYLFWFSVSLPVTVLHFFIEPATPPLTNLWHLLRSFLLGSTFGGSWFLMALIISIPIINVLSRRLQSTTMMAIAAVPYALAVLTSSYSALLPEGMHAVLCTMRENYGAFHLSFTSGLLFCTIGYRLATTQRVTSHKHRAGWLAVAFALYVIEMVGLRAAHTAIGASLTEGDICWTLPLLSAALFRFVQEINVPAGWPYRTMRTASTLFYFSHFLFVFALVVINKHLMPIPSPAKYFITIALCSLLTAVFIRLTRVKGLKWLQYGC